jgi:hypothetical protein
MELYDLLNYTVNIFNSLKIPYFVTGSLASIYYGEPRLTNDIDIVADIGIDDVERFCHQFPEDEFYLSEDAVRDAISRKFQFNIIHPASGLKVDVIITKKDAFDRNRFQRVQQIIPFENLPTNFASPEDVILMKMKYYKQGGSEKHLRDITSILKISGEIIDRRYIASWSGRLQLMEIWQAILQRLASPKEG